jgi:hypothetical protein
MAALADTPTVQCEIMTCTVYRSKSPQNLNIFVVKTKLHVCHSMSFRIWAKLVSAALRDRYFQPLMVPAACSKFW